MEKKSIEVMRTPRTLTLENKHQSRVVMTNLGATLVSWISRDREGGFFDILLGYDDLKSYAQCPAYLGATLGRVAGRIGKAEFELDGRHYSVAANDGANHLHGGLEGFNRRIWRVLDHTVQSQGGDHPARLHLGLQSPHMDGGYPGHLLVNLMVTYNDSFELKFEFNAVTDRPTLVNLSMHPYFNLAGTVPSLDPAGPGARGDRRLPEITDHRIQIKSQEITAIDESLIPTGQRLSVVGTPLDLRTPTPIGAVVDQPFDQILKARGLDHNFILPATSQVGTALARVDLPSHGRALELWTDQPGVQCYTGNWLDGSIRGKGGYVYGRRSGFCLEPQKFPDAPHHPGFPSIMLRPGEEYRHTSIYRLVL